MSEPTVKTEGAAPAPAHGPEGIKPVTKQARKGPWKLIIGGVVVVVVLIVGGRWFFDSLGVTSTDDAYVNGHVTFVAPRVAGQVCRVLVDDNNRVHKGDVLVQLDTEPFLVKQKIAESAVAAAQVDLIAAQAAGRGMAAQTRSARFNLENAIEEVDNKIALLRSKVATVGAQQASLERAQADYDRSVPQMKNGTMSKDEFDLRTEALAVAKAQLEEAFQGVYQVRVSLGLPAKPEKGDLTEVPPDLDQTFSTVRQAQATVIQGAAQLGVVDTVQKTPRQMVEDFYKRDPNGDIDKIYAELVKESPGVKQAEAKLAQAQSQLDRANLDLKYCDVVAEIDGVVTRRNVNPGNNLIAGQSVMAIRSLTEIWVDANFKETQLGKLRIGQAVDLDVDMYGSHQIFKGRISGFSNGTGSTLALLPAQNATGNFVKVVQRLPVRIDLVDYDPDKTPLFVGLSVEPRVKVNEAPTGPNAGAILQPLATTEATGAAATEARR